MRPLTPSEQPRWTFHFTLTSASRLNAVEGFLAKLGQGGTKPVAKGMPPYNRHYAGAANRH
jgi:hypothetical protein